MWINPLLPLKRDRFLLMYLSQTAHCLPPHSWFAERVGGMRVKF